MVDYGNRMSMSTHLRFGFRVFRRVAVLKLFGKSFFFEKNFRGDEFEMPSWMRPGPEPRARGAAAGAAVGPIHARDAPEPPTHASEA